MTFNKPKQSHQFFSLPSSPRLATAPDNKMRTETRLSTHLRVKSTDAKSPPQRKASLNKKGLAGLLGPNPGAGVVVKLESPTSISMKNSLILKNSDASFEVYYKQMLKRKIAQTIA